tara:strand:- start:441 stop:1031 length:591 start_codon:yes stop_codon:yes gene_type:complete
MELKEKLQKKHAELMYEEIKIHRALYGHLGCSNTEEEEAEEKHPELIDELRQAESATTQFEKELMTYPELFDELKIWMVDVVGESSDTCNAKEIFNVFEETGDMHEAVAKHDNVCALVRSYLTEIGFIITDSGGGCGGWHLGVPCTEPESRKLIKLMRQDFAEFFEAGVLKMKRMFWGAKWENLYNLDDAERFGEA